MEVIGIIAEYNPFTNGHLYHIKKIKEMYNDSIIIAVISSSFTQRGNISIINKWDKTKICLENDIDLVIELPYFYSSQSADIFSYGALAILNYLKVSKIVFGSELNDIKKLYNDARVSLSNEYDTSIKKYLNEGYNYPSCISLATKLNINTPNDILGLTYIKEIIKNNYNITPVSIKRTNDFHSTNVDSNIISATAIRNLLKNNKDISKYVPFDINKYKIYNPDIFKILKYKINSDRNILNTFRTVDEGIDNRLIKYINKASSIEEFIKLIKTKRYTYNKINRMFIHIITSFQKSEITNDKVSYIRILGFNKKGKNYLNAIKKDISIPLITGYKNINNEMLNLEYRVTLIYSILVNDESLIEKELKGPIKDF